MALPALAAALGQVAGAKAGIAATKLATGIGKLAGAMAQTTGAVTSLASSLTGGLLNPLSQIQQLADSIGHLVGLFNPGIVEQFTLSLNDTMAVVGSLLVPIMQGMTLYVRAFGGALAGLIPVLQPLFDTIGQFLANYAQGFAPLLEAAAPFLAVFSQVLQDLIRNLSSGLAFLQGVIVELLNTIADLFGIRGGGNFRRDASSKGFAARQTKVTSVEQFARDVFASTARNIYSRQGGAKKPEALLAEIKQSMDQGRQVIQRIAADLNTIWLLIKEGIGILVKMTPEGQRAWGMYDRELQRDRDLERKRIEAEMRRQGVKKG